MAAVIWWYGALPIRRFFPTRTEFTRSATWWPSGQPVIYIGTGTSFTDSSLTTGTTYYYRIYTFDKAFNYSGAAGGAAVSGKPCAPTPSATSDSPVCAGATLHLTASAVSGATYAWTGPNGFTSSDQNPTLANATTAASGTYSVTATLGGCTSAPAQLP